MTREEAIALYKSKFWETMSPEDIVMFQMFEPEMCMPYMRRLAQQQPWRPLQAGQPKKGDGA